MAANVNLTRNFSANLTAIRQAAGLSKSGLAREIWGTEEDSRGYVVAKNRDRIGAWENGKATPTPDNLILLANALDVDPNILAPDLVAKSAAHAPEAISLRVLVTDPTKAHLRIDTVLPVGVATEIMAIVSKVPVNE